MILALGGVIEEFLDKGIEDVRASAGLLLDGSGWRGL